MRRRTYQIMVQRQVRWEIKAFNASEALELAKEKPNYPQDHRVSVSAHVKPRAFKI